MTDGVPGAGVTGEPTRGVEGPEAHAFLIGPGVGALRFKAEDDFEADV